MATVQFDTLKDLEVQAPPPETGLAETVKVSTDLQRRSTLLFDELEAFRLAVSKEAEKTNNHWHAHIPGFSTFWQAGLTQKNRAEALRHRSVGLVDGDSEVEGALHRDLRLLNGELVSYETHWEAIKKCHSVTWFRPAIPLGNPSQTREAGQSRRANKGRPAKRRGQTGQNSVFVSAIVSNGNEWLRVLSISESALLAQMGEADFPWRESDIDNGGNENGSGNNSDGDIDEGLQEILDDEDSHIELLKTVKQLLAAALEIHGGYQHRIRIVLPKIKRTQPAIDRLLRGIQRLGSEEEISVVLECAEENKRPPPPLETAIANLLNLGEHVEALPPLTPILNIDTSILVAMTTDISHNRADQRKWRPKILEDVADEADHGPRLTKSLYPILRGRTLVCTRVAAETCLRMVYDASTDTEVARLEILLGQEDPRGKKDQKMAFLERILRQDGWPLEDKNKPETEQRRKRLTAEFQKLTCHLVPDDLLLPIRIVGDFRREHVASAVASKALPRVALLVEPTLNETNCSSFLFGWKTSNTTITCNRHAVRRLSVLVRNVRWSRYAKMAPIIPLDWARGLAKVPFPGEVLVEGPR